LPYFSVFFAVVHVHVTGHIVPGALVLWCSGALVLWCSGALVLWCSGAVLLPVSIRFLWFHFRTRRSIRLAKLGKRFFTLSQADVLSVAGDL
jgi:hypothetical protein